MLFAHVSFKTEWACMHGVNATVIFFCILGYAMDPHVIKTENRVSQAKLTETINKMCNEARRGISKLLANNQ